MAELTDQSTCRVLCFDCPECSTENICYRADEHHTHGLELRVPEEIECRSCSHVWKANWLTLRVKTRAEVDAVVGLDSLSDK